MKKARIIIGANYGDEGKGTVTAHYTQLCKGRVLNVLTNGGAQRGHSILTEKHGNITFQHFGSGTYHGADSYYSRFFILNPMQFIREYDALPVKPENIYRDFYCRWSTPYDSMANLITEKLLKRQASCGMGIWNTIKRSQEMRCPTFGDFCVKTYEQKILYLKSVRRYYEENLTLPDEFKDAWRSLGLIQHFIADCERMYGLVKAYSLKDVTPFYDEVIFENGQGLLLCDTGKDTFDTTPSNTGISYSLELLRDLPDMDITAHYVTRPYLTRHGDGHIDNYSVFRSSLSKDIQEDRTNHYNEFQGEFRYGELDLVQLSHRIYEDRKGVKYELEVTHCDEMDRLDEFSKIFPKINTYDSPFIK